MLGKSTEKQSSAQVDPMCIYAAENSSLEEPEAGDKQKTKATASSNWCAD